MSRQRPGPAPKQQLRSGEGREGGACGGASPHPRPSVRPPFPDRAASSNSRARARQPGARSPGPPLKRPPSAAPLPVPVRAALPPRARARTRPPPGSPRTASRDRAQPRRQRRRRELRRRWRLWQREQLCRQRGAGGVWVWREGSARPERVSVLLPLPTPAILLATRCRRGPCPELRAAPSCSAVRSPVPAGPAQSGAGCGAHGGGCTPPAAAVADGGVRPAELPVPSERGAPCVRLCGAEEAGPGGKRAATRWLPGSGRGRPGAASSSFAAAAAAASSQCSVSREPRLVDAEPLGSLAARSPRCSCTSAWRPEPCEPTADRAEDRAPILCVSHCPSPLRDPPAASLSFPLGKWFPLPGEMCTSHD
ncbi:uncharacterized protein [Macaca fascicularis]|uniref:uncharacterized protein n=1 Tax=Macaca fascicularis TaxID=9541 RepID=UPI003D15A1D6